MRSPPPKALPHRIAILTLPLPAFPVRINLAPAPLSGRASVTTEPPRGAQCFNFLARHDASVHVMLRRSRTGTPPDRDAPTDKQNLAMRILLADDNAARAGALTRVLAADPGLTVLRPRPGESLVDAVAALVPDVVLVDMARPDRDALEGIRVVAANAPRPILLFVDA